MKSKRFALVLSVLLAVVAGASVYAFTASVDARSVASKEPVSVLVAALQIPAGTSLATAQSEGMVKTEVFPAATLPSDVIKAVDANNGSLLATAPIQPGSLIRSANFAATLSNGTGLSIPSGTVALTVDLKDAERVANFVVAGSKIALVDYVIGAKSSSATRVVVPSVLVLAVGSTATSNGAASGSANLITVAASPADALRIVEAQKSGSLTALLLNDVSPTSANDVTETGIFGGGK